MSLRQQFTEIMQNMRNDPLLQQKRQSWNSGLNRTLQHLRFLSTSDPERFEKSRESVFVLQLAVADWTSLIRTPRLLQMRNIVNEVSRELLGQRLCTIDPPVIFSRLDTSLIPVPFEDGTDYIINCRMDSLGSVAYCYGIAHEIGHLLMLEYIDVHSPQHIVDFFAERIWELGRTSKLVPETTALVLNAWSVKWANELFADIFAVVSWGPGALLHFARDTINEERKNRGNMEYPPTNMRTLWMSEKLLDFRSLFQLGTVRMLEEIAPRASYGLASDFWNTGNSITWRKRRKVRGIVFHETIFERARELHEAVFTWGGVDPVPQPTGDVVEILQSGATPAVSPEELFRAIIEVDGLRFHSGLQMGTMDRLLV